MKKVLTLALVFSVTHSYACPVCLGNPDDPMTKGVSVGILFMLGLLVMVFASFAGFVFFIAKRKARETGEQPDPFESEITNN